MFVRLLLPNYSCRPHAGVETVGVAQNKQTALKLMDAMQKKQWDVFKDLVTDDLVSWVPPSAEKVMGYPKSVRGAQAVIDARGKSSGERYSPQLNFTTTHLIADGDLVAVFTNLRTLTTDGTPYENDYVMLFRFENGKIAEWGEYLDTALAYMQFGLRITKP
jgi:ketosteroid isomerase-like protein